MYRDATCARFTPDWPGQAGAIEFGPRERALRRKTHQTIKRVTADIERFQYNTAISAMMELLNEMTESVAGASAQRGRRRRGEHWR